MSLQNSLLGEAWGRGQARSWSPGHSSAQEEEPRLCRFGEELLDSALFLVEPIL